MSVIEQQVLGAPAWATPADEEGMRAYRELIRQRLIMPGITPPDAYSRQAAIDHVTRTPQTVPSLLDQLRLRRLARQRAQSH